MKKTNLFLIGALVVIVLIVFIIGNLGNKESEEIPYDQIVARFECDNDQWIDVVYYNHAEKPSYAELVLSDGRELTVYQAISASGARYLSEDESIEFWTKGEDVVSFMENGEAIFENCLAVGDNAQLANPASTYCVEQGGESDIRTMADGSQKGFCLFDDGSECEEWAFFQGECEASTVFCHDLCGDGVCEETACEEDDCPCLETAETCPEDCLD